ncbi:hypothetical protein, partial [Sporisorium scitamineum]
MHCPLCPAPFFPSSSAVKIAASQDHDHDRIATASSTPYPEQMSKSTLVAATPITATTSKEDRTSALSLSLDRVDASSEPNLSSFAIQRNQFIALTKKNWIVLRSYWFINLLRCLIVPIAY